MKASAWLCSGALLSALLAACGADIVVGAVDGDGATDPVEGLDAAAVDSSKSEPPRDGGAAPDAASDYAPCSGKACGARCTLCAPDDGDCIETDVIKACDSEGRCAAGTPVCGGSDGGSVYDPCASKRCGDGCRVCAPGDLGCVETAVLKECDRAGKCVPGFAECGPLDGGVP